MRLLISRCLNILFLAQNNLFCILSNFWDKLQQYLPKRVKVIFANQLYLFSALIDGKFVLKPIEINLKSRGHSICLVSRNSLYPVNKWLLLKISFLDLENKNTELRNKCECQINNGCIIFLSEHPKIISVALGFKTSLFS